MGYEKFLGMGCVKYTRMGYEKFFVMGYKKFLGMGYGKFLGMLSTFSPDFPEKDFWERFLGISTDFLQNCYLGKNKTLFR